MATIFSHPSGASLLSRIKNAFETKNIYRNRDFSIIFLCGGSVERRRRTMRKRFLKCIKSNHPNFLIILAESVIEDIKEHCEPEFINLVKFESLIGEISDCIMVFPESEGSIAEFGFFSGTGARKKVLVANDINQQHDSFINLGLVETNNNKSLFRPVMSMNYQGSDFTEITRRLSDRLPQKTRKKYTYKKFNEYDAQEKMFLIFQIIHIFKLLRTDDVIYCIRNFFGKSNIKEVKYILSILTAANFIIRASIDPEYFYPSSHVNPFYDFDNTDIGNIKADVVQFLQKHHPATYDILKEVSS